jgi:Na+-transporting methylmalonyl-CoA/oxaloacetate decarboxylase beta subunit
MKKFAAFLLVIGAGAIIVNLLGKRTDPTIIGGADGATSIFVADQFGINFLPWILAGIALLAIGMFVYARKAQTK